MPFLLLAALVALAGGCAPAATPAPSASQLRIAGTTQEVPSFRMALVPLRRDLDAIMLDEPSFHLVLLGRLRDGRFRYRRPEDLSAEGDSWIRWEGRRRDVRELEVTVRTEGSDLRFLVEGALVGGEPVTGELRTLRPRRW